MAPPQQLVLAASSTDAGVAAWDLRTGAEAIRHRTCASRPRALTVVAGRFLAASQAPAGNSAPIHYYHWDKVNHSTLTHGPLNSQNPISEAELHVLCWSPAAPGGRQELPG